MRTMRAIVQDALTLHESSWSRASSYAPRHLGENAFSKNAFFENFANFWRARSRLYQNEILQENMRLTAFFKLYKICILLHRCNLKFLAKNYLSLFRELIFAARGGLWRAVWSARTDTCCTRLDALRSLRTQSFRASSGRGSGLTARSIRLHRVRRESWALRSFVADSRAVARGECGADPRGRGGQRRGGSGVRRPVGRVGSGARRTSVATAPGGCS